jgi:cobalamin-dependent methionine synthase I
LNLGPRKKDGEEVFPWMVEAVEAVVDVPLSFDSTNLLGIEAGLKKITKAQPIINSTSAEPERLEKVPLLAKQYNARLIALTMGASGHSGRRRRAGEHRPRETDPAHDGDRLPDAEPDHRSPGADRFWLPGILPAADRGRPHPAVCLGSPPCISVGLSNVSNAVPRENRALINRVYCAMLMGVGLQMMIADPLDEPLKETIRIIEERDASTPVGRLYLAIADRTAAMEEPTAEDVDFGDPQQVEIWKTVQILLNKVIYADSYLQQ